MGGSAAVIVNNQHRKSSNNRRANKPLVEKKRRARINGCLGQLKGIILDAWKTEGSQVSRLEKADILEMTVKYLRQIQKQQPPTSTPTSTPKSVPKFSAGYSECASEVIRYMDSVVGVNSEVRARLESYLLSRLHGAGVYQHQFTQNTHPKQTRVTRPYQHQSTSHHALQSEMSRHYQTAIDLASMATGDRGIPSNFAHENQLDSYRSEPMTPDSMASSESSYPRQRHGSTDSQDSSASLQSSRTSPSPSELEHQSRHISSINQTKDYQTPLQITIPEIPKISQLSIQKAQKPQPISSHQNPFSQTQRQSDSNSNDSAPTILYGVEGFDSNNTQKYSNEAKININRDIAIFNKSTSESNFQQVEHQKYKMSPNSPIPKSPESLSPEVFAASQKYGHNYEEISNYPQSSRLYNSSTTYDAVPKGVAEVHTCANTTEAMEYNMEAYRSHAPLGQPEYTNNLHPRGMTSHIQLDPRANNYLPLPAFGSHQSLRKTLYPDQLVEYSGMPADVNNNGTLNRLNARNLNNDSRSPPRQNNSSFSPHPLTKLREFSQRSRGVTPFLSNQAWPSEGQRATTNPCRVQQDEQIVQSMSMKREMWRPW